MPYALCPMPYALYPRAPHVTEKGYSFIVNLPTDVQLALIRGYKTVDSTTEYFREFPNFLSDAKGLYLLA